VSINRGFDKLNFGIPAVVFLAWFGPVA